MSLSSTSLDIEGQGPLIFDDLPHERTPLLHADTSDSESSISVSTTRSAVVEDAENVKKPKAPKEKNVAAIISLLLIGK